MFKSIVYVSIPERFIGEIKKFNFDPSILLPVEANDIKYVSQDEISIESVISAILKIFVYDPENLNIPYYRNLILSFNPNIFANLIDIGLIEIKRGRYNFALEIFLALKIIDSKDEVLLLNLAFLYELMAEKFLQMKYDRHKKKAQEYISKASEIYEDLLNRENPNKNVYINAGLFFIKQYKLDRAEGLLKKYLSIIGNKKLKYKVSEVLFLMENQRNFNFNLKKIYNLIILFREDEAINKALKMLDLNKSSSNIWFLLGWAYRRKGFYKEAIDSFLKFLIISKDSNVSVMNELAICYIENNELDMAIEYLNKALNIEPNNIKIILNIGILYLKMNKKDKAKNYFKIVLDFDPNDSMALKFLSIL